jgi:oligoribonuclease (3'-5' exoribonuclease)
MVKLCPQCERPLKPAERFGVLADPGKPALGYMARCDCGWEGLFRYGLDEPQLPIPKPALPYLSIDIETTGLDPETCQILEIGAVYDNWTKPIHELPTFHCYVEHKQITGTPFALALNASILRKLDAELHHKVGENPNKGDRFVYPDAVAEKMTDWLRGCGWDTATPITPAGKNFASFDRQFLKRLPDFERLVRLHHRTLDPATLYWWPTDEKLPDSKTCYERAGMDGKVAHTALEDALGVVQLIRTGIKRLRPF